MIAIIVSGCVAAAVGAVAVTAVDIIHDRRTVGEYVDDGAIETKMRAFLVSSSSLRKNAHVSNTSWNGILLLTGEVSNESIKQQIIAKANNIDGVRQVVDETRVAGKTGFLSRTSDTWVTGKVKGKMVAKMGARANRIKVISEHGNVYLMGIVTKSEAEEATNIARSVRGVVRVVKVFEYGKS